VKAVVTCDEKVGCDLEPRRVWERCIRVGWIEEALLQKGSDALQGSEVAMPVVGVIEVRISCGTGE
jgi:hypothetical protein